MARTREEFIDVTVRVTNEVKNAIEQRAESLGITVPELFRLLVFLQLRVPRQLIPDKGYSTKDGSIIKIGFKDSLVPQIQSNASKMNLTRSRFLRSLAIRELEEYTGFKE